MEKLTIWILLISTVCGYFHEKSQQKYDYVLPEKSLFGYSITYLPSSKSLIVSAPNADNIGRVFSVSIDSRKIDQINITVNRENEEFTDRGFWLGATVKSINNSFLACAPRHTSLTRLKTNIGLLNRINMAGVCYITNLEDSSQKMPLIAFKDRQSSTNSKKFEELMDTFGWSVDVTKNTEVLVGGPEMTGRVSIYKDPFHYVTPQLIYKKSFGALKNTTFNFGYSVVSGKFSDKMQYAFSSTYGTKGFGKVYFYDSSFNNVETIGDEGNQVGSMFGAALCAINLGAEHDYLLVGAPVNSEIYKYDVGAVFLYAADSNYDDKMIFIKKILGTSSGGYFGNTIITLGDMDGDGKDEVAIGAPYENEYQGAVYIYTGAVLSNINSDNNPIQVIRPQGELRYFGFSLTTLQDYDDNGCNELAVGAPRSNAVVVYRSFASVKVVIQAKLDSKNNRENKTQLEFESCLEITYPGKPQKIIGDIIVKVETPNGPHSIVGATDGILTYTVSLEAGNKCKKITVLVNQIRDQQIVSYNIKAELKEDPRTFTDFNPSRVLLSSQSILSKSGLFSITNCDGEICMPLFKINFSSSMPTGVYTIGSSNSEWFSLSVTNEGDTGYEACIEFVVSGANILKYPSTCTLMEFDSSRMICTPRKALHNGTTWDIDRVLLETKDMTSSEEMIEILYHVYNHCNNESDRVSYSKKIILQSDDSKFLVTGEALPDPKINFTSSDLTEGSRTINHIYTIQNNGITNWVGVKSNLVLPDANIIDYQIFIINRGKNKECLFNGVPSLDGLLSITCDIGDLFKTQQALVFINIKINPESLDLNEEQTRTLTTNLHLLLKNKTQSQSVSTIIQLRNATVPLWMIIAAVCVGLLILFIIAFALYECGFLRRENKVKLQRLRKSVYRQSMRRTLMREDTSANTLKDIADEAATLIASRNNDAKNEEEICT